MLWPAKPLAGHLDAAHRAEVQLLETTRDQLHVTAAEDGDAPPPPARRILEKGYDSDPWRQRWAGRGRDRSGPHRTNRRQPRTQDGRKRRRSGWRWDVERTFAGLGTVRRVVVRESGNS